MAQARLRPLQQALRQQGPARALRPRARRLLLLLAQEQVLQSMQPQVGEARR